MNNIIQELFRTHRRAYELRYGDRMPANHKKVLRAICACGTGSYGQHTYHCKKCGNLHGIDGSCGNRHCPVCQKGKSNEWLEKQLEKVLPVNYFMVTFTVPQELRRLIRSNQKVCYTALFKAASDAMKKLAKDPRFVGCHTAGFTGILHTWTRQLEYHPHLHFIVPSGGINSEGTEWKASSAAFFIHAKPLSKIYRAKLIEALKAEGLSVPASVWDLDWVVDCRRVGNGQAALKYLAKYVFRVAIAPSRILRVTPKSVTFKYQRSGEKKWRTLTLSVFEFMRRYLQHTLPHGFTKIRHYGFMSPNARIGLEKIRTLICRLHEIITQSLPPKKPRQKKQLLCTVCGAFMQWSEFTPPPRGPG